MEKIVAFFKNPLPPQRTFKLIWKKAGVELTESLFIDVTIPKPAPTLKVSQIFVLPIPRLGSCEEVKGESEKLRNINMTRSNQAYFISGSQLFGCYQLEAAPPTQRDNKTISHLKWAHHASILSFRVKQSLRMKLVIHRGLEDFFVLCYAIIEGALWPLLSLVQECIIKPVPIKSYHAAFLSFGHRPTSPYWWQIGIQQQLYLKGAEFRNGGWLGWLRVTGTGHCAAGHFWGSSRYPKPVHRSGGCSAHRAADTVAWHLRTYIPASIILEHFSTALVWEREKIGVSILLKFYTKMDTFKWCRMKVHVALREQKNFHQRTTAPPLIALWISSMEGFRQTSATKHHAHMFHLHLRDRTWTYRAFTQLNTI